MWYTLRHLHSELDAAVAYDARKRAKGDHASKSYPDIVIIITGQGPQKTMYEKKINELIQDAL